MEWGHYFNDFIGVFIIIKLMGFVLKWRFSLLGSMHSAAKTLPQITHCECSTPSLSVTIKPKLKLRLSYFLVFFLAFFFFVYINFHLPLLGLSTGNQGCRAFLSIMRDILQFYPNFALFSILGDEPQPPFCFR